MTALYEAPSGTLHFDCPGCGDVHAVSVGEGDGPRWTWNGSLDKPTFMPSLLARSGHHIPGHDGRECWCTYNDKHSDDPAPFACGVCHSFVTDGQIQFLADSTHALAGQTVPIPDWT